MKPYTGKVTTGDPRTTGLTEDELIADETQNKTPANMAELDSEIARTKDRKARDQLIQEKKRILAAPGPKPYTGKVTAVDDIPRETTAPASNWQNFIGGVTSGFSDLAVGAKQRLDEAANYAESKFGGQAINQALGLPNADTILAATNKAVVDKRQAEAPVMDTKMGKAGKVVATAVPAALVGMLPGGQGLAASMVTGAGLGAVEPTVEGESVIKNAALGTAGGAVGYGVGKAVGAAGNKLLDRKASVEAANAAKDATIQTARDIGYALPPAQANPTVINRALEGFAGKLSTAQSASIKNAGVTNRVVAKELGLPVDQPITIDALKGVRAKAGEAYNQVKQLGTIVPGKQYFSDLDGILAQTRSVEKSFPGLGGKDIESIIDPLQQKQFNAGDAIEAIKLLRKRADGFYAKGDKEVAGAYKAATKALEDAIQQAAEDSGRPDLLSKFLTARADIAKSYSVEKALNEATGNVSARKLGAQLSRGKPLSGDIKKAAQVGQAFPKATEDMLSSHPGISPLDYFAGAGLGTVTGNPGMLGAILGRPAVRSAILSRPYQSMMTTPSYSSPLGLLLTNPATQQAARVGLMGGLPYLTQQ